MSQSILDSLNSLGAFAPPQDQGLLDAAAAAELDAGNDAALGQSMAEPVGIIAPVCRPWPPARRASGPRTHRRWRARCSGRPRSGSRAGCGRPRRRGADGGLGAGGHPRRLRAAVADSARAHRTRAIQPVHGCWLQTAQRGCTGEAFLCCCASCVRRFCAGAAQRSAQDFGRQHQHHGPAA